MQQKELASLLDISPAMVSRLVKRGMPTDTLERAERWRKRHLEPGRVKGSRFGTAKSTPPQTAHPATRAAHGATVQPAPAQQPGNAPANAHPGDLSPDRIKAAALSAPASLVIVELWSHATHSAQTSDAEVVGEMVIELRALLRRLPFGSKPRMALGVWLALTDYGMHPKSEIRQATDLGTLLNPDEFSARVTPAYPSDGHWWLEGMACDWEGYAVNGWPAGWEDETDD